MAEPTPIRRQPGDDIPVGSDVSGQLTILNATRAYKREAEDARRTRMRKNANNRSAYMAVQDWTHKTKGQSREFIPKVATATEQFVSFAKRALTQFGAWYDVELTNDSQSPLSSAKIRSLMTCFTDNMLVEDNKYGTLPLLISDGLKVACLESLMIIKIHGKMVKERVFSLQQGEEGEELLESNLESWHLKMDLVRTEDYFPDPTGAGLYEIQHMEKDLSYVKERAREGIYNKVAVARIEDDMKQREARARTPEDLGQNESQKPGFRKKVQIDECWGSIVDANSKIVHRNVFWTIANDRYVIRKPTPNPFWHQKSPFVVIPLLRVPFSVWHKALMDDPSQLNFALNEIFNLMLDGGLASVWGIKQLRTNALEDPREVSDGIPQGATLQVNSTLPPGDKVLEVVATGTVPPESQIMYETVSREFASAALSNELKLGSLPAKQVKATEIVELSQSQAVTLDGILSDVEHGISELLTKTFLTILQNIQDVKGSTIVNAVGVRGAFTLSKLGSPRLFAIYADMCAFKVHGLSAVLAKVRDFQKTAGLMQLVGQNPVLLQEFFKTYSPRKILAHLMRTLAINPEQIERDSQELDRVEQDLADLQQFTQLTQGGPGGSTGGGGGGIGADTTGGPELPAEINQASNPLTGLGGGS